MVIAGTRIRATLKLAKRSEASFWANVKTLKIMTLCYSCVNLLRTAYCVLRTAYCVLQYCVLRTAYCVFNYSSRTGRLRAAAWISYHTAATLYLLTAAHMSSSQAVLHFISRAAYSSNIYRREKVLIAN